MKRPRLTLFARPQRRSYVNYFTGLDERAPVWPGRPGHDSERYFEYLPDVVDGWETSDIQMILKPLRQQRAAAVKCAKKAAQAAYDAELELQMEVV